MVKKLKYGDGDQFLSTCMQLSNVQHYHNCLYVQWPLTCSPAVHCCHLDAPNMNTSTDKTKTKTRFCWSETGLVITPKSRISDFSRDKRAVISTLCCRPTLSTRLSRVQYLYCRPSNHALPFIITEHRLHHASMMK